MDFGLAISANPASAALEADKLADSLGLSSSWTAESHLLRGELCVPFGCAPVKIGAR